MKQNIKLFLIALIIGMISSYILCTKFDSPLEALAFESKITYFYVGSYNDLSEATTKKNKYQNALIYNDNGIYKVIIGLYSNKESIDLMSSYFIDKGLTFQKNELKVSSEFKKSCESYEVLIKTSTPNYYDNINNSLLNLFNEYIS